MNDDCDNVQLVHYSTEQLCKGTDEISVSLSNKVEKHVEGNKDALHRYIIENIIRDDGCVSMKILTDVYGFEGNDRKKRHYVKKIIKNDFPNQITFITNLNEPQSVARIDSQNRGNVIHSACHDALKQTSSKYSTKMRR